MTIELPEELAKYIREYSSTNWKDGRDPSGLGALNAVAYIGEQVAALVRCEDRKARPVKVAP